jgi:hypothetical protein
LFLFVQKNQKVFRPLSHAKPVTKNRLIFAEMFLKVIQFYDDIFKLGSLLHS